MPVPVPQHLSGLLLDSPQWYLSFLSWGAQDWTQHSAVASPAQGLTLATLLLLQPRLCSCSASCPSLSSSLQPGALPGVPLAGPCCTLPPGVEKGRSSCWSFQSIAWHRSAKHSGHTWCHTHLCALSTWGGGCLTAQRQSSRQSLCLGSGLVPRMSSAWQLLPSLASSSEAWAGCCRSFCHEGGECASLFCPGRLAQLGWQQGSPGGSLHLTLAWCWSSAVALLPGGGWVGRDLQGSQIALAWKRASEPLLGR